MTDPRPTLLGDEDRSRLAAFREAAKQIREASIIARGHVVNAGVHQVLGGETQITWRLLEHEPFRSLAMSLRLVYEDGQRAHFYSICSLLWNVASPGTQARVAMIRRFYRDILTLGVPSLDEETGAATWERSAKDVFDAWMYGATFHQNPKCRELYELLQRRPENFAFSVQGPALLLCGRVLDLDDIIADILGEPPLPRIAPPATAGSAAEAES